MRKAVFWQVRWGVRLPPHLVCAIINLTPDSFYDGGRHDKVDTTLQYCKTLMNSGVQILDLGGESTRPGATPLAWSDEWQRLEPILAGCLALKKEYRLEKESQNTGNDVQAPTANHLSPAGSASLKLPACASIDASMGSRPKSMAVSPATFPGTSLATPPTISPTISIDTYNAATAAKALELGADIINDISAFEFDPRLKDVLLEYHPGYVLMHSKGRPKEMQTSPTYQNAVQEVIDFLSAKMDELLRAGFPEENIILDPGIGFGKTLQHNLALLQNLDKFKSLGRPLFVGISNKSLFGDLLGLEPDMRKTATQVLVALLAEKGVYAHRVHEALETLQTLHLVRSLKQPYSTSASSNIF